MKTTITVSIIGVSAILDAMLRKSLIGGFSTASSSSRAIPIGFAVSVMTCAPCLLGLYARSGGRLNSIEPTALSFCQTSRCLLRRVLDQVDERGLHLVDGHVGVGEELVEEIADLIDRVAV